MEEESLKRNITSDSNNSLPRRVFICVYRHIEPSKKQWNELISAAQKTPSHQEFSNTYKDNYYDWGDDPSFFAAKKYLGDEKFATWGVCRANVRKQLIKGDVVVFICGRQTGKNWKYYYIGYGTVSLNLKNRLEIWKKDKYEAQRGFYNLLIDKRGAQFEPFGGIHDNLCERVGAGYIFFETASNLTNFNFVNPLYIADCNPDQKLTETWKSNKLVKDLENLLLKKYCKNGRSLRSTNVQRAHPHIRLKDMTLEELTAFRSELLEISKAIKSY